VDLNYMLGYDSVFLESF